MRSPVSRRTAQKVTAIAVTTLLAACGGGDGNRQTLASAPRALSNGPESDYPVTVGQPFTVDGVTYTPIDKMNYDQVGYAGLSDGEGVSIAHRTLPLPSYAEVTSLESGRTILVRVTRRGPMTGSRLADLSPAAAAQLGVQSDRVPIRVRRVNPPEPERAALRAGGQAPARMDTPKSLVAVLLRKLDPGAKPPVLTPLPAQIKGPVAPTPAPVLAAKPPISKAPVVKPAAKPVAKPEPATAPGGSLIVQVGAFGSEARSSEVAGKVGGHVAASGKLFRVRMGPFASRGQAEAALAKARAAGYSDARIQRAD